MADIGQQITEHLKHREAGTTGRFHFLLRFPDKFWAHGMGVVLEELLDPNELREYELQRRTMLSGGKDRR